MTENKRFTYSNTYGWQIGGFLNVMNGLDRKNNELKERIKQQEELIIEQAIQVYYLKNENKHMKNVLDENKELETRNKRQYNLLTEITDLMMKRDWKGLEKIVEDWEESDRLLQAEWGNCGDVE